MSDLKLSLFWLSLAATGVVGAVMARRKGLHSTYIRDVLHVGAGFWVFGWNSWKSPVAPIAVASIVAMTVLTVPFLSGRFPAVARWKEGVTGEGERWRGIALYSIAYTAFTAIGLFGDRFSAGGALLALSLGDGLGGAAGRRLGIHSYRFPGGTRKTWEGSFVVAVASVVALLVAARLFGGGLAFGRLLIAGSIAALAEAIAPRGTDNILLPVAVWVTLTL